VAPAQDPPDTDSDLERRVVELEVRFTHQDRALGELSDVVYRQQQVIDLLERRLKHSEKRLGELGEPSPPRAPEDDVPPHY
jgi:SlyX protein